MSCTPCVSQDYANQIYDARRSNFWDYACLFNFADGGATFPADNACCGRGATDVLAAKTEKRKRCQQTNIVYTQPNSFAEYMRQVHDLGTENGSSSGRNGRTTSVCGPLCRCQNCRPCTIEPESGGGVYGSFRPGCCPQPPFQRKMIPQGGPVFKPASALPVLDRYQWVQPESLYHFDTQAEWQKAYDGIYNANPALEAKFHFQNPAEQQRLWYGIKPPQQQKQGPQPKVECTQCGLDVPIPYYRGYLESNYSCGCNQRKCDRCS